jgi:hypothetical protein
MQSIHPVEAAWRGFRRDQNLMGLLERSLERQKSWIRDGIYQPVPEVVMPRVIAMSVVDEVCRRLKDLGFIPAELAKLGDSANSVMLTNSIAVWSAWRDSKRLYLVDPALAESLARMRWPETAPTESLKLPARCAVLELPAAIKGKFPATSVYGGTRSWGGQFFDNFKTIVARGRIADTIRVLLPASIREPLLDRIVETRRSLSFSNGGQESAESIYVAATYEPLGPHPSDGLELNISSLTGCFWMVICRFKLDGEHLGACARATEESFRYCSDTPEQARAHWADPNAKLAMILFLHMAGDEDVVRMVHPGERPIKDAVRRHDPERFKDLAAPTIYSVGRSFGRAVERWETERGTDAASEITGGTVRPHHRAAHYHRYWTGVGRLVRRWRFLLPISVKSGRIPEEPPSPLKHKVR